MSASISGTYRAASGPIQVHPDFAYIHDVALASNPALEAIVREHDDDASWQVLEDWLLETNDPRARLVRLEKAGEDTASVLRELEPLLLGAHAPRIEAEAWRAGFARRAAIFGGRAMADVGSTPALSLVRELTFDLDAPVLADLGPLAPHIERLSLKAAGLFDGAQLAPFARLERLRLEGAILEAPDLSAPSLRHLELALVPRAVASVIRANPLAELRSLSIVTGALLYPWHGVFDRLFDGACAPKLVELALDAAPTSGNLDFVRDLAQSALGQRIERLSLAGTECSPSMLRRFGRSIATLRDVEV